MLLDGNPKGCEVAEHIATKVELNPRMLSTLKKRKIHLKNESRGKFRCISVLLEYHRNREIVMICSYMAQMGVNDQITW